jgi:hypothetical protein
MSGEEPAGVPGETAAVMADMPTGSHGSLGPGIREETKRREKGE